MPWETEDLVAPWWRNAYGLPMHVVGVSVVLILAAYFTFPLWLHP